jgi:predicted patatin/cPLA2 family phospholipase
MVKTEEKKFITTKVLRPMYNEITKQVERSPQLYRNEVDFIHEACREKLERISGMKKK